MEPLRVFVFNVGQGDNILIELPDGTYGFIDFFYDGKINNPEVPPSLTFITNNQVKKPKVAFVHLSHYHFDHLKGVDKWIKWINDNSIQTQQIWMPGILPPKTILKRFVEVLNDEESIIKILEEYPELTSRYNKIKNLYGTGVFSKLEDFYIQNKKNTEFLSTRRLPNTPSEPLEIKAYCLAPHSTEAIEFIQMSNESILLTLFSTRKKIFVDGNDISAILQLKIGDYRLLFGGDAKKKAIVECHTYISDNPEVLGEDFTYASDFIKVFHHGSANASSKEVWDSIFANIADACLVISAGDENYGHPDIETLEHICASAVAQQTEVKLFSTNFYTLAPEKQSMLNEVTKDMYIDWPADSASSTNKQHSKEQLIDCIPFLTVAAGNKPEKSTPNLGYCFEFDLNGKKSINIYNLLKRPGKKESLTS